MTIKELFEKSSNGLFTYIYSIFEDVPFKDFIHADKLDEIYSRLYSNLICSDLAEQLTMQEIASYVYAINKQEWTKLWDTYMAEYDPIENYNKVEKWEQTKTGDDTVTHTGTDTLTQTGTDTLVQTGTDTLVQTGTDTIDRTGTDKNDSKNSMFPYGDDTSSELSKSENIETRNMSDVNTKNLTDATTKNLTDTTTKNLTDTNTKNLTDKTDFNNTIEYENTTKGNIGVTTAAQMQEEVKNLYEHWNYFDSVFNSINKLITIGVYFYEY